MRGRLRLVGGDEPAAGIAALRKRQWGELGEQAREQFYAPQPGAPYAPGEGPVPPGGRGEDGKLLPPPAAFAVLLLQPEGAHYLRLGDDRALAFGRDEAGEWVSSEVNA